MFKKHGQAVLGFILAFGVMLTLTIGITRIWGWFSANYAGRSIAYQKSRPLAAKPEVYDINEPKIVDIGASSASPETAYEPVNLTEEWVFNGEVTAIPGFSGLGLNIAEARVRCQNTCAGSCPGSGQDIIYDNCECFAKCVCQATTSAQVSIIQRQIRSMESTIDQLNSSARSLRRKARKCSKPWRICFWGHTRRELKRAARELEAAARDLGLSRDILRDQSATMPQCCTGGPDGSIPNDTWEDSQERCFTERQKIAECAQGCQVKANKVCKGSSNSGVCIRQTFEQCKQGCLVDAICLGREAGQDLAQCCLMVKPGYDKELDFNILTTQNEIKLAQEQADQFHALWYESMYLGVADCVADTSAGGCKEKLETACNFSTDNMSSADIYQYTRSPRDCFSFDPVADPYCKKICCQINTDANGVDSLVCGMSECKANTNCLNGLRGTCDNDCNKKCDERCKNKCPDGDVQCLAICDADRVNPNGSFSACQKDCSDLCYDEGEQACLSSSTGGSCFCVPEGRRCGTNGPEFAQRKTAETAWNFEYCSGFMYSILGLSYYGLCEPFCDLNEGCDSNNCTKCSILKTVPIARHQADLLQAVLAYWQDKKARLDACCAQATPGEQLTCLEDSLIPPPEN